MIYFLFQNKRYWIMNDYYKQFEMLKFYFRDWNTHKYLPTLCYSIFSYTIVLNCKKYIYFSKILKSWRDANHDFNFKWMIMPRIELEICSCYEQTSTKFRLCSRIKHININCCIEVETFLSKCCKNFKVFFFNRNEFFFAGFWECVSTKDSCMPWLR